MKSVRRFEANLIHILRYFVRQEMLEQVQHLLEQAMQRPRCLSRTAIELIEQSLGQGCMLILARSAWQKEKYLRNAQPKVGRLWERTSPEKLGLSFSVNSLEILMWVTATEVRLPKDEPEIDFATLTLGDRLLSVLSFDALQQISPQIRETLAKRSPWRNEPLLRLISPEAFPDELDLTAKAFAPWTAPESSWLLEVFQPELRNRLVHVESMKRKFIQPEDLRRTGQNQEQALAAFAGALNQAGRLDLARFLLEGLARIVRWHSPQSSWFQRLDTSGLRLADRATLYEQGLNLLRFSRQLRDWQNHARSVAFYDEDYQASQLWKELWEKEHGEATCDRAEQIVHSLQPLAT